MRSVFQNREAYDSLRAKGQRDAKQLTWARNAQTVEEIYWEAIGNSEAM